MGETSSRGGASTSDAAATPSASASARFPTSSYGIPSCEGSCSVECILRRRYDASGHLVKLTIRRCRVRCFFGRSGAKYESWLPVPLMDRVT